MIVVPIILIAGGGLVMALGLIAREPKLFIPGFAALVIGFIVGAVVGRSGSRRPPPRPTDRDGNTRLPHGFRFPP